ncbi:hypothetical protein SFB21_1371 [Acinetobacter bouvetii]|uniref:Uncharacterized protein n=1 Tax=Acinetobacter bouvetii TaxID=202951 RepID=A0A811GA65_9GAMM|nr:hypothetical protein SFB21_1371 [Acinetobacter bouvetii]
MFNKVFLSISMAVILSTLSSAATAADEVAPCTNGFDDVNVCQLRS